MSSKIHLFHPTVWNWVSLIGPDARDFLHRVTTVNAGGLGLGEGAPGFFLTPQGKVRASFALWNYGPDEFAFEFSEGASGKWKSELLSAIDQFTFAERMTLTDVSGGAGGLESRWIFVEPGQDLPDALGSVPTWQTRALEDEIRVCHHGERDYGQAWITVWGRGPRLTQWVERNFPDAEPVTAEKLDRWRIQAVRPLLDAELNENTIPLEVGLKDAISDNKGCYPGQEVIERIVALGSPARRLARIEGTLKTGQPAPQRGEKLLNQADPPAEVGEISSIYQDGDRFSALAMIRKIHAKEGLPVRTGNGAEASIQQIAPYT